MNANRWNRIALVVASTLVASGCAVSAEGPDREAVDEETYPQPEAAGDDASLAIDESSSARVSGSYTRAGATIAFSFDKEMRGKHITIATTAGRKLIDAIVHEDLTHETSLLDGRLIARGRIGEEPAFEGDRSALEAINAMPEARAVSTLESMLVGTPSVSRALLPIEDTAHLIGSQAYGLPCGSWTERGGSVRCGTWFFGATSLRVVNYSRYFNKVSVDGQQIILRHDGGSMSWTNGWYWGRDIYAYNYGYCPAPYCGSVNFWPSTAGMVFSH